MEFSGQSNYLMIPQLTLFCSSRKSHPFSIDKKGCKKSRACKLKLFILDKFKCGGVIFEQVFSFPVFLKILPRLISLTFQCPRWSTQQGKGR
jgi:hypothetical protein